MLARLSTTSASFRHDTDMIPSTPITWFNLPRWILRTARADRRSYRADLRAISLRRILCSIKPDLCDAVFIVGAPRSGTTFLGDCLCTLPTFSYHFEPVVTKAAARYVFEQIWRPARSRRFYRSVYAWLLRLQLDGDLRFAEKTPRNCFLIDFLEKTFPRSKFIHIIRDGRDAALSLRERQWLSAALRGTQKREPGGYLLGPVPRFWVEPDRRELFEQTSDLHRCAWAWRRHTEAALHSARHLPDNRYLELRYESLVATPWKEADRLLHFLDMDGDARGDEFREAMSNARNNSVGRWKQQLSEDDLKEVLDEAGELLKRLGYQ